LDMGFAEDLETIFSEIPAVRQTVLFSATIPARIEAIARRYLSDPVQIRITEPIASDLEAPRVRHNAYVVPRAQKAAALGRILDAEAPTAALVFCRTRETVDSPTETPNGRGYRAEALHGGMNQEQRDVVMGRLRAGTVELLVATDVAARGLDIDTLSHVANYDVPASTDSYVHRMGRVGRAGREGVAITLVEPREHRMLKTIERETKRHITIEKVPTVAEVRARRLDLTRALLRETILEDDLDGFRVVVESLADEFDVVEIALAAVKVAHAASGGPDDDDEDIRDVSATIQAAGRDRDAPKGRAQRAPRSPGEGRTRLYVSVGREAGVRPQDLVGAITGETYLSGGDIGAIEITQRFSLVEVPEASAADVIEALRGTKIRGRRATVRRERF
jgi:ATP-dependent RNA helicase DeaD